MNLLNNPFRSRVLARGTAFLSLAGYLLAASEIGATCPELPSSATMVIAYPGHSSYVDLTVSGAGPLNGTWPGWCVQVEESISRNTTYNAAVYCFDDPAVGSFVDKPYNLGAVNWIINQNLAGNGYNYKDVQTAIWRLIDNTPNGAISFNEAIVSGIVAEALENADFRPDCGELTGVILHPFSAQPMIFGFPVPPCVPCPPSVELTKTAMTPVVAPGGLATYQYEVKNTGCTTLTGIELIDDNGTPGFTEDDFLVETVDVLEPGASVVVEVDVYIPVDLCSPESAGGEESGILIKEVQANGDVKVTFIQNFSVNDNTYGANSIGWNENRPHRFQDLVNSDHAVFRLTDGHGNEVLKFAQDYISASSGAPSGYKCLGATGGDGKMLIGSAENLYGFGSSLEDNLNQVPFKDNLSEYTVNSPDPADPSSLGWEYYMIYRFTVKQAAFGAAGFGDVTVVDQHNSPAKSGTESVTPTPCGGCVVNLATVTAQSNGTWVRSTATAEVCAPGDNGGGTPLGAGTGTPGYWKNHPEAWPVQVIEVGGVIYSKEQAIELMNNGSPNDGSWKMFYHIVPAMLNVLIGNDDSCIASTISAANDWLVENSLGSNVKSSSAEWSEGSPLQEKLDDYNNGRLCAPSRG